MAQDAGDTSELDTSVGGAAQSIAGLLDQDSGISVTVPAEERDEDEDTEGGDRGPTPTGEGDDQQADDPEESDHTDDDQPSKRKLTLPDGAEVDEDEAIKGYLRQADYTKKTQAVAEERKKIDGEYRPQVAKYAEQLKALEEAIQSITPHEPDWTELRKRSSAEDFSHALTDWQVHERRMVKLAEARVVADRQVAEEQARENDERSRQGYQRLMELVPEWKDDTIGRAERQEILRYAEPLGLTADHLKNAAVPELFVILRDAMRYRKLVKETKGKPPASQKVADRPVLRPGSANAHRPRVASDMVKAVQRAAQTGSTEDAGAAIRKLGLVD